MDNKEKPSERIPLSGKEYYGLRALIGIVSTFETELGFLEKRLRNIKMGWCNARLIAATADRLLDAVLATVPQKKLQQIRQEIGHTRVEINVTPDYTGAHRQMFTYVPNDALEWLEDQVIDMNCLMCEKTDKESKRCPVRKNIEALYAYDFPERKGCPIAQMNIEHGQTTVDNAP